jgi:hypothetical protein
MRREKAANRNSGQKTQRGSEWWFAPLTALVRVGSLHIDFFATHASAASGGLVDAAAARQDSKNLISRVRRPPKRSAPAVRHGTVIRDAVIQAVWRRCARFSCELRVAFYSPAAAGALTAGVVTLTAQ